MTGKTGAPLTEAMFYVLMALRRGELCGTELSLNTHLTLPTNSLV